MTNNTTPKDKPLFVQLEEEILAYWRQMDTFRKSMEARKDGPTYVFYEGPPTANAPPALHHMMGRAFKDLLPRYKSMQGYYVGRKAGWDTHGLPVELQIEKKLGISGKPQIENLVKGDPAASIKKFNEECKESVWEYKKAWEEFTERTGYWLELENPYITFDAKYVESLWWVIKQFWDKELLYKGHKVVPYCPRCGTALSSHEVAQGYKEVEEESVYVTFPVRGQKNTSLVAWTTTPWTLPGNVALAVGKDETYVRAQIGKDVFILAKDRLEDVLGDVTIVEEFKGKELVGMEYEPLFPVFEVGEKKVYTVLGASFVTTTDGTGIVHTAVMYGEDDYDLGVKEGLPQEHTVDEEGKFTEKVTQWAGKFVKSKTVTKEIISDLESRNRLLRMEPVMHDYPHCWRCSTPLLYYARDSWFVKMSSVNDQLMANNETVDWHPSHLKHGRFGEWIKEGKDWAFSRERYWGTPLPVWVCDSEHCEEVVCIGSFEELKEKTGETVDDPHRPFIDEFQFPCGKCDGTMVREKDVVDVWFDSGAMPFAQWHYPFENKEKIDSGEAFPAEYISEAIDQTRGWFYTLLAVSTALGKGAPYKHVSSYGHLLDKDGKKMSKSKGNIVDPWKMMDTYGADAVRLYFYSNSRSGEPMQFDEAGVNDVVKKTLLIWWNTVKFYQMYPAKEEKLQLEAEHIMDKWVLARLHETISEVTAALDGYQVADASRVLTSLVTDVSTWYVRSTRGRLKDETTREEAARTLYTVLVEMTKLFAPFMPMVSEAVFQKMDLGESVHFEDWPVAQDVWENKEVLKQMAGSRKVIEELLSLRQEAEVRIRQPLAEAQTTVELDDPYQDVVAAEVNVKQFNVVKKLATESHWQTGEQSALNTHVSDSLKKEGLIRDLVRKVNDTRKKSGFTIEDRAVLYIQTSETELREAVEEHKQELLDGTLSDSLELGTTEENTATVNIQDLEVTIGLGKA